MSNTNITLSKSDLKSLIAEAIAADRQENQVVARSTTSSKPTANVPSRELLAKLEVPESLTHRELFAIIVEQSYNQLVDGNYGPGVMDFIVAKEAAHITDRTKLIGDLIGAGFIREGLTKADKRGKSHRIYFPVAFDSGEGRGARSARGSRSSDLFRSIMGQSEKVGKSAA